MAIKVLMVCLGNICRSPLAHGILEHLDQNHIFEVDSAGTSGFHQGSTADQRSCAVAKKHGIDLSKQRSRKLTAADLDTFDLIYVMDKENLKNTLALTTTAAQRKKVKLILNEMAPNQDLEVPDPYYGGTDGFENVYGMLEKACTHIIKKYQEDAL